MTVKVSVLMPVYNGERYLHQAVESILNQTYSDFEFIILDDGSNDSTVSIVDEYAALDKRIVLVRNETNIGITRSLNRGIGLAQGEYIARMDADDISLPERLTAQISFLGDHPEVGVLGTAAYLVDSHGSFGQLVQYPERHDPLYWIMCFFENPIIHPSVMLRRKLIMELGGYDENYTTSQDYNLWSRMVAYTKLANIQEAYLHLRKHGENISQARYHQQQEFSLQISASLLSRMLNIGVNPAQIQDYCAFLWNHTKMPGDEISFAAGIIYRLANILIKNTQMIRSDRIWIIENAVDKLQNIKQSLTLALIEQVKLDYWVWSLKHSIET